MIGAGAAGIITARQLMSRGFRPHLFDRRTTVGGAWQPPPPPPPSSSHPTVPVHDHHHHHHDLPQMWETLTPNLSKYTCGFSDLPWSSDTPMFPSLTQMNQYLQDYCTQYQIQLSQENDDDHHCRCTTHFGCTVTRVSQYMPLDGNDTIPGRPHGRYYEVQWNVPPQEEEEDDDEVQEHGANTVDRTVVQKSKIFDGVVMATGFFSQPIWPVSDPTLLRQLQHVKDPDTAVPTFIHSSQYQSSLAHAYRNRTVAVIGNSFSAHEIASELSLAQRTPSGDDPNCQRGTVIHVVGNPNTVPYVLPRNLVQRDEEQTMVVPIDAVIYRRRNDRSVSSDERPSEQVILDPATSQRKHSALQQYIGRRKMQQATEKGYRMMPLNQSQPPHLSISDYYIDCVIDDQIQILPGRLIQVVPPNHPTKPQYAIQLDDGTWRSDIDAIICCTGYQCSLPDVVDANILRVLQYDPQDRCTPMIAAYDTIHPDLPNFGMIGMYKGPYFGVMELQAKLYTVLLERNSHHHHDDDSDPIDHPHDRAVSLHSVLDEALLASQTRRCQPPPRPQFPHFDYMGLMDHMTALLHDLDDTSDHHRSTTDSESSQKGMMVSPFFYDIPKNAMERTIKEYKEQLRLHSDKQMATTVISALIGTWTFDRVITDSFTQTTQVVTGTIRYSLRHDGSVRYREDGRLKLPNGIELDVFREYDYIADSDGSLEIKFVENGIRTYRFLSLKFSTTVSSEKTEGSDDTSNWLTATSDHLCVKDLYTGTFQIQLDGCSADSIRITYNVQGPKKDYVSVTNLLPIM